MAVDLDKLYERKYREYLQEISGWDWDGIVREARQLGAVLLGSSFNLAPSGKHYAPWSPGITERERTLDQAFWDALDTVAERRGGWIESSEGDPTDVLFVVRSEEENPRTYRRRNVEFGHYDPATGKFHPWRHSRDYDPRRAGEPRKYKPKPSRRIRYEKFRDYVADEEE